MSNQKQIDSMDVDSNQTESTASASPQQPNNTQNEDENKKQNEDKNKTETSAANATLNGKKPMDRKKKAALQDRLRKQVASNRNMILVGCGDWRCTNPHCKSNLKNKDKAIAQSDASKLAVKLVKAKSPKCGSFPKISVTPLSSDIMEEKKEGNKQIILDAFTHWDILYDSFKTDHNVSNKHVAIDFNQLDRTFSAIMSQDDLCKDIQGILDDVMSAHLQDMRDGKITCCLNSLRALVILLECPIILSEDIGCHHLLNKLLLIFEEINSRDFKSIKIIHEWFSSSHYISDSRIRDLLHSLHQYMTLQITLCEDEIEDLTDDWRIELKYDDVEDNDERDEINQDIEKRQQTQREKYIKDKIAAAIKFIDIIFVANTINMKQEEKETDWKMDIDDEHNDVLPHKSMNILDLSLFHNDGLNEAICSKTASRSHIHRRDFIHYKEHDFFTFLSYPYLLSAASKSRYLEFENLLRQHRARRRRMFDLMLGGGVNVIGNRNQLIEELDLVLRIRRNSIIQDTLGILQLQEPQHLRKRLRIIFDGEQGIDQGGLTKEYFQLIMKELFDPNYGMFIYNKSTQNYWFNRDSFDLIDHKNGIQNYELVGKLIGIAIYNNTILDLRFPRVIFKKLLETERIVFDDFEDYDPEMAKAFKELLRYNGQDIEDVYCRTFVIKYKNVFGIEKEYDLIGSDGDKMSMNQKNKSKYVDLYIKYTLTHSIEQQFNAFLRGFKMVCDSELFHKYSSTELELLICGSTSFDFDALESSTKYEDGLHKNSRLVRDFWATAHELSDIDKRKLLTFCTGSDRVPINGLGELHLTISKNGNDNTKLPTSHTCFNHLLLPEYSTKEILKTRLLTAIQNSEGFGLL